MTVELLRKRRLNAALKPLAVAVSVALLTGCFDDDDDDDNDPIVQPEPPPEPGVAYRLQLLHAADMEGGVEAVEDAPRFSAVLNALADDYDNTVILSAGDNYIPGPFFAASNDGSLEPVLGETGVGRGDIVILNAMGFQAAAFGNHEFDTGPGTVADLIEPDGAYPGTHFPYLSANLDFSRDGSLSDLVVADGQPAGDIPNSIAGSTTITVGGETLGIVGATTPALESITTLGDDIEVLPEDPANLAGLAAVIQAEVDELTAAGIDKVILLAHMQQISIETQLAALLSGVDIIVAGGSNTVLADSTDRLREGDTAADTYPLLLTSASGEPVALVNTDGNYKYVGRLVAEFTEDGVLIEDSIDPMVSGAYATDEQGVAEVGAEGLATARVVEITDALEQVIVAKDGNTFGATSVYLNGVRGDVRTQETNLGNLTADANLYVARQTDPAVDISIKNGGGIRDAIGFISAATGSTDDYETFPPRANPLAGKAEGEVSQLDIENSLRFNNELTLLTVTAQELKGILEHAVAASEPGATPGRFPQVGGIRFSFDTQMLPRRTDENGNVTQMGQRVRSLAIVDEDGLVKDVVVRDGMIVGDPNRTFRLVTLNFLAGGGDGYPFDRLAAPERVDLVEQALPQGSANFTEAGSEQDALAEYLNDNFALTPFNRADTPPEEDERIQNLRVRAEDTVLMDPVGNIELSLLGRFDHGGFDAGAAEIVAYHPGSRRLFVVNGEDNAIDVLNLSDPANPTLISQIDLSAFGDGVTSVAVSGNVVAAAVPADPATDPGRVVFMNPADATVLGNVQVGVLPDMVTFSPDGRWLLSANEGQPSEDYTLDPEGSVSIVDLSAGVGNATVRTAGFTGFNARIADLRGQGVRIFGPGATVAQDLEPEYIAVAPDSATAYVTLQENNALAVVDVNNAQVTAILPLGTKDHSIGRNSLDASNRDDGIRIRTWPVVGMYQPDAIALFQVNGNNYLITANEGDARDYDGFSEEARVADLTLDPMTFTDLTLQAEENLGRLNVTTASGDRDGDGDIDVIHAYGARSFTVWDAASGEIVYDSGDRLERITAAVLPERFNSNNDDNDSFDARSDDKGPEPEGVTVGVVDGVPYGFIGLERIGGIMVYDLSDPRRPAFVQYLNSRDFDVAAEGDATGDLGPEGLVFIPAADSPDGRPLLVVGNEVSGTTAIYGIRVN